MNVFILLLFSVTFLTAQVSFPINIAHRGASHDAPENTLAAFHLAKLQKADALELDVRMTADSQLVVLHDAGIDRTTDGSGNVSEIQFQELRSYDAGSWFDERFSDEKVPLLEEVLALADSVTTIIIEIKSTEEGIEQRVINIINTSGKKDRVILKSFYPDVIQRFAQLAPDIPRIYVFAFHWPILNFTFGTVPRFENIFDTPAQFLQIHRLAVSRSFIRKAHLHGFSVIVWGVNSKDDMEAMIELGADGIETDRPWVLHKLIEREKE